MGVIAFTPFNGIRSELTPNLLPEGYAVECTNCFIDGGNLDAWDGLTETQTLGKTGTINTLSLMAGSIWLHFTETANVALAPIANNDKFYSIITGLDKPRYTNSELATTGGGQNWPNFSYHLGFPAPALQIDATVGSATPDGLRIEYSIAGTESDPIGNKLAYTYVYTFADAEGREGPPSTPSNTVYASTDDQITLTNIEALAGTYNPVGTVIRIYRSEEGSPFQFLVELSNGTSSYIDDFTIAAGSAIETTLWSAPPTALAGIVTMANGIMAGYKGNDLYLSEPYQPSAWPEDYILHTDYPIKGLASVGNTLIVTTEKYPYVAVGTIPVKFTMNKLDTIQANVSTRSIIDIGKGAMYASNDGIVMVTSGGASVVSKEIISEKTWQEMNPSSIHAVFYREKYMGFYNAGVGSITTENGETIPAQGSFLFDPVKGNVTYSDVYGTASYSDVNTGNVYIVQDDAGTNKVYQWHSAGTKLAKVWKSRPIFTRETTMTAGRIELKSGSVNFELWTDDILRYAATISDSNPFRMPSGYLARKFQVKITGTGICDGVFISSSVSELP